MFVSGPWPVRVGRAGQEADGGEVGGGGGGVGLRDEAARRSGAASEVAVWACGVAAAARAAATAPGLRLFILGALGGVAGVWEGRESGVCMRFSTELEGERMRTSGLLGAGGGGAAGAGAGAAGSAFAILQASCHRRISACSRLSACFAARAALRPGACVSRSTLAPLIRARFTLGSGRASLLCSGGPCCTLGGRVHADAEVSGNPEPTAARQDLEEVLDDV